MSDTGHQVPAVINIFNDLDAMGNALVEVAMIDHFKRVVLT